MTTIITEASNQKFRVTHVSSNLPPLLGSSVPCPLMVNIQKYFVISPCPCDDILVLVLQVHQAVVGGWISQSDEIVKDHTSCDDFSACLWPLVHGPQQNSELVCQNTKGILHYTPGSGESVGKYSLMVLHVSDDKRVHQALVDPKSIVPYYVVWDMNVITR